MSLLSILSTCLILMLTSLLLVSLVNRQQTRRSEKRSVIQSLERRLGEQEDLCGIVEPLLESTEIVRLLNFETIRLIERLQTLEPKTTRFDARLERAERFALELDQRQRPVQLNRLAASDLVLAKYKYSLTVAVRQLRSLQSQGHFDLGTLDSYLDELAWAQLMVNVVSFVGHGHKAASQGDATIAMTFYRKAQNLLMNTPLRDQRRLRCIEELADIIALKRSVLSPDLMPETRYKPTSATLKDQDSGKCESDKSDRSSRSA